MQKNITTTGKIFVHIDTLKVWDKNPRQIDEAGDLRLRKQLAFLGQYKPLLGTQDGLIVGGNMRLKEMVWLNSHIFTYKDTDGNEKEIDKRGAFNEIWFTELSFGKNEENGKYKAMIDGKVQDREYNSIEQIMIEYALSDNDSAGTYDQQALHALIAPHQALIPLENYRLELSPATPLKSFMAHPERIKGPKEGDENETMKDKKIVMRFEFSPETFKSIEPRVQKIREDLGVESNADLLTSLLEMAESVRAKEEAAEPETPSTPEAPQV